MNRLLVVEDDRWLASLYRDLLNKHFIVTICHDAQTAIETLDSAQPALILLDIMLPGGNGIAFLQELRSYDDTSRLPVVVCSSTCFGQQERQALEQFQPLTFIDKAELTPEKLLNTINEARRTHAAKH